MAAKILKAGNMINPQAVLTIGNIERTKAFFPGQIDEVRLFARPIDEAELAGLVLCVGEQHFAAAPQPGPVNFSGIAPWALQAKPVDRFADPLPSPPRVPFENQVFELRPGEVVVTTGSAHGVFEQQQGWLETLLTHDAREKKPVFRCMSWEGDTVFEQWRAMNFGSWEEQFDAVGASLITTWFGQVEALDDSRSVADFTAAYAALLDRFQKRHRELSSSRRHRSRSLPAARSPTIRRATSVSKNSPRRPRSWRPIAG